MVDDINSFKGIKEAIETFGHQLKVLDSVVTENVGELKSKQAATLKVIESMERFNVGMSSNYAKLEEAVLLTTVELNDIKKRVEQAKHPSTHSALLSGTHSYQVAKFTARDLIVPAAIFVGIVSGNLVAAAITVALHCV